MVRSTPSVADGAEYVGSSDYFLYAIDAERGDERWRSDVGAEIEASLSISHGVMYTGSLDTLSTRWTLPTVTNCGGSRQCRSGFHRRRGPTTPSVLAVTTTVPTHRPRTGPEFWRFHAGNLGSSSPIAGISEAVYLSDQVGVFSTKPATATDNILIDMGRPRAYDDPTLLDYERIVMKAIGIDV